MTKEEIVKCIGILENGITDATALSDSLLNTSATIRKNIEKYQMDIYKLRRECELTGHLWENPKGKTCYEKGRCTVCDESDY